MIIEAGCGMLYRESSVDFTNKWLAKTGERSVEICAGQTSGQGGVQVTLWNASATAMLPAERQPRQRWFPVPEGHGGALTIVDAVGETLTLQADDGAVFRFDCAALKYVDDPTPKPD